MLLAETYRQARSFITCFLAKDPDKRRRSDCKSLYLSACSTDLTDPAPVMTFSTNGVP